MLDLIPATIPPNSRLVNFICFNPHAQYATLPDCISAATTLIYRPDLLPTRIMVSERAIEGVEKQALQLNESLARVSEKELPLVDSVSLNLVDPPFKLVDQLQKLNHNEGLIYNVAIVLSIAECKRLLHKLQFLTKVDASKFKSSPVELLQVVIYGKQNADLIHRKSARGMNRNVYYECL